MNTFADNRTAHNQNSIRISNQDDQNLDQNPNRTVHISGISTSEMKSFTTYSPNTYVLDTFTMETSISDLAAQLSQTAALLNGKIQQVDDEAITFRSTVSKTLSELQANANSNANSNSDAQQAIVENAEFLREVVVDHQETIKKHQDLHEYNYRTINSLEKQMAILTSKFNSNSSSSSSSSSSGSNSCNSNSSSSSNSGFDSSNPNSTFGSSQEDMFLKLIFVASQQQDYINSIAATVEKQQFILKTQSEFIDRLTTILEQIQERRN